ncbi:MAG: hypothetical protein LBT89_12535, partial [Planctomycetaceae bacterium]|nr:hypothetical protein [Planctomycetaceae bacterium]
MSANYSAQLADSNASSAAEFDFTQYQSLQMIKMRGINHKTPPSTQNVLYFEFEKEKNRLELQKTPTGILHRLEVRLLAITPTIPLYTAPGRTRTFDLRIN